MAGTTSTTHETICDHAALARELPYLRRFARALSNNAANSDDLVHDCIVKALENSDKFEPGTNLRAWLFTILRNCFISDVRRNRRSSKLTVTDNPSWLSGGVDAPRQESSIMLRRTQEEICNLPLPQREVLLLVVVENMSYEQTAQMLKLPVGTIRSRLSRARQALSAALDIDDKADRRMVRHREADAAAARAH
jgi:RNA polymerase sigma-70 factor (ECF subfamily)